MPKIEKIIENSKAILTIMVKYVILAMKNQIGKENAYESNRYCKKV